MVRITKWKSDFYRYVFIVPFYMLGKLWLTMLMTILRMPGVPFYGYLFLLVLLFLLLSILGYFRKCCSVIKLEGGSLYVRYYFGLDTERVYPVKTLEGFKLMRSKGRGEVYYCLCLFVDGKTRIKVLDTTHHNYAAIKAAITPVVPYLGRKKFNFFEAFEENLFW